MRSLKTRAFSRAMTLVLVAVAVYATVPMAKWVLMLLVGGVLPNRPISGGGSEKPLELISVGGHQFRPPFSNDVAAYHILLVFPSTRVTESESAFYEGDVSMRTVGRWLVQTEGRTRDVRLESRYDAAFKTLKIDGRRYRLSKGNVFVVRLGDGRPPRVAQLDTTVAELTTNPRVVECAVRARLPDDAEIQRHLGGVYDRYGLVRCLPPLGPPRKAATS